MYAQYNEVTGSIRNALPLSPTKVHYLQVVWSKPIIKVVVG